MTELEKLEKQNEQNKMEKVRVDERLVNLTSEKKKIEKQLEEMGITADEADFVLEESQKEFDKMVKEAKEKLSIS